MKRKELTKQFMVIANTNNSLVSCFTETKISAFRVKTVYAQLKLNSWGKKESGRDNSSPN